MYIELNHVIDFISSHKSMEVNRDELTQLKDMEQSLIRQGEILHLVGEERENLGTNDHVSLGDGNWINPKEQFAFTREAIGAVTSPPPRRPRQCDNRG